MKAPTIGEERRFAPDGTELVYFRVGEGRPIVLAHGLVGGARLWTPQFAHSSDRYRWLTWEYRGLVARDSMPAPTDVAKVEQHARDGLALMDAEGIAESAVVGWSFGVQVALEMFRLAPSRVTALVLIGGGAAGPWRGRPIAQRVVPSILAGTRRFADALSGGIRRVSQWPETLSWAKRLGIVSATLDQDLWHEITDSSEAANVDRVLAFIEEMGKHDVSGLLPTIDVPTLVISGDRDLIGTREAAEHLARTIRGAELMTVPGGGHFVAAEYPDLVNLRIEKFLRERGYADPISNRRPGAETS